MDFLLLFLVLNRRFTDGETNFLYFSFLFLNVSGKFSGKRKTFRKKKVNVPFRKKK